jgi:hypothetical protein
MQLVLYQEITTREADRAGSCWFLIGNETGRNFRQAYVSSSFFSLIKDGEE